MVKLTSRDFYSSYQEFWTRKKVGGGLGGVEKKGFSIFLKFPSFKPGIWGETLGRKGGQNWPGGVFFI